MSLTKSAIVDQICQATDLSRTDAANALETLLETTKTTLERGDSVMITGFGKFQTKKKSERRGRNPYTGDNLTLEGRRVVTFKCSGVLKDKLNSGKA